MAVLKLSQIAAASDNLGAGDFIVGVKGGTTDALFQIGGGTVTVSDPILDMSQTWNAGAVAFTALKLAITNTASDAASLALDIKIGSASIMTLSRTGALRVTDPGLTITSCGEFGTTASGVGYLANTSFKLLGFYPNAPWGVGFSNTRPFGFSSNADPTVSSIDTGFWRDGAAGIMGFGQANSATSASTFRVYNTTDQAAGTAPTNYERGVFDWTTTANVLTIGAQAGGSGTLRPVAFVGASYQFASSGGFSANATVATVLGSLGPSGAHTTVQKWLTIKDDGGTTLYIPCF